MGSADQFDTEISEIRDAAFRAGGLQLLERVEVALAAALRHLARVRSDGPPIDDIVEQEIRTALSRARELIAAHS